MDIRGLNCLLVCGVFLAFYAGVDMECHFLGLRQPVPGGLKRVSVSVLEGKRRTEGG